MCGRYTIAGQQVSFAKWAQWIRRNTRAEIPGEAEALVYGRFNVAPTQPIGVIKHAEDGRRRLAEQTWGVQLRGRPQVNARDDQLLKRWGWLMERGQRVGVLADGWYEWSKAEAPGRPRQPWHFRIDGGEPFAFAGLASRGEALIVTTSPNPTTARVHDRMPTVLADQDLVSAWLDLG